MLKRSLLIGLAVLCAASVAGRARALTPPNYMCFFDTGLTTSTHFQAQIVKTVKAASSTAKSKTNAHLTVIGHADAAEVDVIALSTRRTAAIRDMLIAEGIPAASITILGKGKSQPLVAHEDGISDAQNRRAEIVVE